jgi:hypothetical protein
VECPEEVIHADKILGSLRKWLRNGSGLKKPGWMGSAETPGLKKKLGVNFLKMLTHVFFFFFTKINHFSGIGFLSARCYFGSDLDWALQALTNACFVGC